MNKPLIGITSYPRNKKDRFISPAAYLDAVADAGGIPVILPSDPIANPEDQLQKLDGIVLSGGGDICASFYGEAAHELLAFVNKKRDKYEMALAKLAAEFNAPTLAICRGIQIVNVVFGGTLHQHIPDNYGDEVMHRSLDFKRRTKTRHLVSIDPNSKLSEFMGECEIECSSFHHQSVKELAPGFKAVAWSPDNVIEAIESDKFQKLISVQWHPEYNSAESKVQQRLFDVLIEMADDRYMAGRYSSQKVIQII